MYFIIGGLLRRMYGGWLEHIPVLRNRTFQTILMLLTFLSIYLEDYNSILNWIMAIGVSCWLQFQFWARGHGACFDIGRGKADAGVIARYNERWYHYPVDWLFDKVFKRMDKKYGFLYDFLYMGFRYTCPMIPMMFFDWKYILVGLAVSPIYAICWTLFEREPWIFQSKYVGNATNLAETIVGSVVYSCCFLLGA